MSKSKMKNKDKANSDNKKYLLDIGTAWHMRYINESSYDIHKIYKSLLDLVLEDTLGYLDPLTLPIGIENDFLNSYMINVERRMKTILSKYSVIESLFWSRRIAPHNILDVTDLTLSLYREVYSLSIFKYCKQENNMVVNGNENNFGKNETIIPNYISNIDYRSGKLPEEVISVITDMYNVELLSAIFVFASQTYRRLNKGCKMVFSQEFEMGFGCPGDENQNKLLDMYDNRLPKNTILSNTGTVLDNTNPKSLIGLSYSINPNHRFSVPLLYKNKLLTKFKSNYIPYLIDLAPYHEFLSIFSDEFENHYGFTINEFIAFIDGLTYRLLLMQDIDISFQVSLLQRSYFLTNNLSNIVDDITGFGKDRYKYFTGIELDNFHDSCTHIVDHIIVTNNNRYDISLWTRGPRPVIYQLTDDFVIFDFSGILNLLQSIALPIGRIPGDTGNRRSRVFEEQVNRFIVNQFGEENVWIHSREVSSNEGKKKEIDASLIYGEFLFIFECKAINVSFGFDRGDKESVEFRINKFSEALSEVDDKADFLSSNWHHLNINIPDGVRFIVPVVISPFAEYIWELTDELFLTPSIPRICTITDIPDLKNMDFTRLLEKDFIRKII